MFSFLNNIPPVTKNLLIINVLMFIVDAFFRTQHVDLDYILGAHYINSPLFQPYQIVSHFFMHADLTHIAFNMLALVMFGGFLERIWGGKRFFILFISSAIGAFALYNAIGVYQIIDLKNQLMAHDIDVTLINSILKDGNLYFRGNDPEMLELLEKIYSNPETSVIFEKYYVKCATPSVGASGGIFGILAAFAILFPNTPLMLIFFPVPIKAKYFIGGYVCLEILLSFYQVKGDNIAHLAHVGGAIVGALLVFFWRKDRRHFY
jgi:membrane associated rhomboid family serine protease